MIFKKKEKKTLRRFDIPDDKVREIFVLYDKLSIGIGRHTAKYDLWMFIQGLFPETKDGLWEIELSDATSAYIIEKFK